MLQDISEDDARIQSSDMILGEDSLLVSLSQAKDSSILNQSSIYAPPANETFKAAPALE